MGRCAREPTPTGAVANALGMSIGLDVTAGYEPITAAPARGWWVGSKSTVADGCEPGAAAMAQRSSCAEGNEPVAQNDALGA